MHVPADWADAAAAIAERRAKRVVILGPVDVGKSTFARFLLEHALARGQLAGMLDSDVGQKNIGPPACVTLGRPGTLALERLAFVGATNPLQRFSRTVDATRRLADGCTSELLIVNTSGLLAGAGFALKRAKIAAVRPDLLIALGSHPALTSILEKHSGIPGLQVSPSPEMRRKSEGERRRARAAGFREYFASPSAVSLATGSIRIDCEREALRQLARRLLVGVTLQDGREAMGLVLSHTPERLDLLLPSAGAPPARLVCGAIALDEEFREKR